MGNTIKTNSLIERNKEIIGSAIDGETVMMSVENGKYYGVNSVGSSIWDLIEEPIEVDAICDALLKEYDISREACEKEVVTFLEELQKNNIITVQ